MRGYDGCAVGPPRGRTIALRPGATPDGKPELSGMRTTLDQQFEEFVRARPAALLRTAVLLAQDAHTAQDLLQEALWRTHRHWARAVESPDAYVRRVLVNLAHDG